MKKITLLAFWLIIPLFCFAQANISALAGRDGYYVMRATLNSGLLLPGLSATGGYSLLEQDTKSAMSQYSLGVKFKVPTIDLLEVGVQGSFIPKANDYSNYSYDIYGAVNIENLLLDILPSDEFKVGAGYRTLYHTLYSEGKKKVNESDLYGFVDQQYGNININLNYTKAISFNGERGGPAPAWLDIPYFTAVYRGYMNYSVGAMAGYTYKIFKPYMAYNLIKTFNSPNTDDFKIGVMGKIAFINANASVEWFNFSRNTAERNTFFTLSAGVSLL